MGHPVEVVTPHGSATGTIVTARDHIVVTGEEGEHLVPLGEVGIVVERQRQQAASRLAQAQDGAVSTEEATALREQIARLLDGQPFAVLCTQGGGQPYGSVVAFAFDDELSSFVFATPKTTRKYRLLSQCARVALVVDNRGRFPGDLMKVSAVTCSSGPLSLGDFSAANSSPESVAVTVTSPNQASR